MISDSSSGTTLLRALSSANKDADCSVVCCSCEIDKSSSSLVRSNPGSAVAAGTSCPGGSDASCTGTIAVSTADGLLSAVTSVCPGEELDVVSGVVVVVGFELVVGEEDDDDGVLLRGVQMIRPEFGSVCGCHDGGTVGGCRGVDGLPGSLGCLRADLSFFSAGSKILDSMDLSPSSSSGGIGRIGMC